MTSFIETFTGNIFDYDDIESNIISIVDIAWSLSNTCRYNGHTSQPWTVAEHSVLVCDLVGNDPVLGKYAMLHDASEAYLGDMVGPLKRHLKDFKAIEHVVESMIYEHFGLDTTLPAEVKYADLQALGIEKDNFMSGGTNWPILDDIIFPDWELSPGYSQQQINSEFLARWNVVGVGNG